MLVTMTDDALDALRLRDLHAFGAALHQLYDDGLLSEGTMSEVSRRTPVLSLDRAHAHEKPVYGVDVNGTTTRFRSVIAAARYVARESRVYLAAHQICDAANGKTKTAYGLTWRYDDRV